MLVSVVHEKPGSLTAQGHPSNGPSMTQLPSGSEGTAYGVLAWAFVCFFSNLLIIWLLVLSKEKGSCEYSPSSWQSLECGCADSTMLSIFAEQPPDLFFISCAALIANSTSIAQLIMLIMSEQTFLQAASSSHPPSRPRRGSTPQWRETPHDREKRADSGFCTVAITRT